MQILWKRAALLSTALWPLATGLALACGCQGANSDAPNSDAPKPAEPKPASEEKPALKLGALDKEKTFALKVGDIVEIALSANPTTGFEWTLSQTDAAIFVAHGASQFDVPPADVQGAATIQRLRFRALKSGQSPIHLAYKRPWESDDKTANRWSANFTVSAP